MKIRKFFLGSFLKDINFVVRFLIISDVMIVGAAGMLAPLFALFVEDFIAQGDAMVVSISMGIYLLSRSLMQIPVATTIDKIKGEKDDFWLMVIFSFLSSLIFLLYLVINQPWQLFLIQFLLGIANAITFPSYMAIFTRHIDKNREGTAWGVYYTMTDLSSATLAVIGGYLATSYGFKTLIITVSLIGVLGSVLLVPIKSSIKRK